jgi:putative transposase
MPRKHRIHYRNAYYHVMLRGNNRQNIFHTKDDYHDFMSCLNNIADSYAANIHLYCLMTNHIHLVIEVQDIPISKIMQSLSTKYARRHNQRYNTTGHLFQGRFKSKLIQDDQYLLELCYYIHMNPVKAGICRSMDAYLWSSHHVYMNKRADSKFVTRDHIYQILAALGSTYQRYMHYRNNHDIQPSLCAFGDDGTLDIAVSVVLKGQKKPSLALENVSLHKIAHIVCECLDVPEKTLSSVSQDRNVTFARSMIAYFGHYHAKYTFDEIAAYFCMLPKSISSTMHRYLRKIKVDGKFNRLMEVLESKLGMSDLHS